MTAMTIEELAAALIGQRITTRKSHRTGTIRELAPHQSPDWIKVRFTDDRTDRDAWTSLAVADAEAMAVGAP